MISLTVDFVQAGKLIVRILTPLSPTLSVSFLLHSLSF